MSRDEMSEKGSFLESRRAIFPLLLCLGCVALGQNGAAPQLDPIEEAGEVRRIHRGDDDARKSAILVQETARQLN